MLCISIFYNKQNFEQARLPHLVPDRALAHDYLHDVLERPRQLSNYDLCLCDWHLPLIVRIHAYQMRNFRTRGPDSQNRRRLKDQRRQQEREERDQNGASQKLGELTLPERDEWILYSK